MRSMEELAIDGALTLVGLGIASGGCVERVLHNAD